MCQPAHLTENAQSDPWRVFCHLSKIYFRLTTVRKTRGWFKSSIKVAGTEQQFRDHGAWPCVFSVSICAWIVKSSWMQGGGGGGVGGTLSFFYGVLAPTCCSVTAPEAFSMQAVNIKRFCWQNSCRLQRWKTKVPWSFPLGLSANGLVNKIMSGAMTVFNSIFRIQGRGHWKVFQQQQDAVVWNTRDVWLTRFKFQTSL